MSELAERYAQLFRVWPMRRDKTPLASGFGADKPRATWDPARIKDGAPVGILCGPLSPQLQTGYHILGLDLDEAMSRSKLEQALGCALPETLTSKGWRHAYYFIPAEHPLHQRNGAITCEGGALDIRPCAGGYLIEKDEWDRGFDPLLIAEFPPEALTALAKFCGEKRVRDGAPPSPSAVQISDRDRELARELAELWVHDTTGDRAFGGLGGWLARRGVSRDRAETIAGYIAEATVSTHPDPLARVAQAYDGDCPLGRPALLRALAQGADEGAVALALDTLEDLLAASTPGYVPPPEAPTTPRVSRFLDWSGITSPIGQVPWLIEGLEICPGRPPVFVSDSGVGKTLTLQALALAVASGQDVFGRFPCRKGPVLHLSRDSGLRAVKSRYQALARGMGIDRADVVVFPHDLPLTDRFGQFQSKGFAEIAKEAERGKYVLVILDSLAALCPGIDENKTDIGDPLRYTVDNETVWLWTHHTTKGGDNYRGSGAIKAAAGAMWGGSRAGDVVTWTPMKFSEEHLFDTPKSFNTEWQKDADGGMRIIAVDAPLKPPALEKISPELVRARVRQGVIDHVLKNGASSKSVLEAEVSGKAITIREVCKQLCEEGMFAYAGNRYHLKKSS
jgi:hypothetical protein